MQQDLPAAPAPTRRSLLSGAAALLSAPAFARAADKAAGDKLVLLGTEGGPIALKDRKMAGQALVIDGRTYLVDVGYGVYGRMVEAGLGFETVDGLFVTHLHSDHITDYPFVAYQLGRSRNPQSDKIHVVGPPPIRALHDGALAVFAEDVAKRVAPGSQARSQDNQFEVKEMTGGGLAYEDSRVKVTTALGDHPPFENLAYRFDSRQRSVVISGDTRPSDAIVALARGADILVHEAMSLKLLETYRTGFAPQARQGMISVHTTCEQAGAIATRAGVKTLVLSHLIPGEATVDDSVWRAEAARTFKGRIIVGRDLLVI